MYWIGTSGWSYRHWKGGFYPERLPAREWLRYYAQHLNSVEINATFYRLQRPETFARWAGSVPADFTFAFKASRYLTHTRRLTETAEGLERLLASTEPLAGRRGPMLLQLPPALPADPPRLAAFLDACPKDLDVAVEFRDSSWFIPAVEAVLRQQGSALVWSDYPSAVSPQWDTAAFLYVRRHGTSGRFAGRYGIDALRTLAVTMRAAAKRGYCYFNNDADGAAVLDAMELTALVGDPSAGNPGS